MGLFRLEPYGRWIILFSVGDIIVDEGVRMTVVSVETQELENGTIVTSIIKEPAGGE